MRAELNLAKPLIPWIGRLYNPVVYHIEGKEVIETSVQPVYNVRPASLSTAPNRSYYSTNGSFFAMVVSYDAVQYYRRLSDCYTKTKQKLLVLTSLDYRCNIMLDLQM